MIKILKKKRKAMLIDNPIYFNGSKIKEASGFMRTSAENTARIFKGGLSIVVLTGLACWGSAAAGLPMAAALSIGLVALCALSLYQSYLLDRQRTQSRENEKEFQEELDGLRTQVKVLNDQKRIFENRVDGLVQMKVELIKSRDEQIRKKENAWCEYKKLIVEYSNLVQTKNEIYEKYSHNYSLYLSLIKDHNDLISKYNNLIDRIKGISEANQLIKEVYSELQADLTGAYNDIHNKRLRIQQLSNRIAALEAELEFYQSDEVF